MALVEGSDFGNKSVAGFSSTFRYLVPLPGWLPGFADTNQLLLVVSGCDDDSPSLKASYDRFFNCSKSI